MFTCSFQGDAVYLSPPWGGPAYAGADIFDIQTMLKPSANEILDAALLISPNIAFYLPRNVNLEQLSSLAKRAGASGCELERNIINGKVKTITAYFGDLVAAKLKPSRKFTGNKLGPEDEEGEEEEGQP